MKKGVYIYSGSKTRFSGVEKKIDAQIKVMSQCFDVSKVVLQKMDTNILTSIMWRLPFGSWGADYLTALDDIERIALGDGISFFYIRCQFLDRNYIRFLKTIRNSYPKAKVLFEIPTYPYERELLQSPDMWPWFLRELLYRCNIKKCIDRVITFSNDERIYDVPTIRTINGTTISDPVASNLTENDKRGNSLHLLAVAQYRRDNGYERIIRSLYNYIHNGGTRRVILDFVGYGRELTYYYKLVRDYNLEDYVVFHGEKDGDALRKCYESADAGMSFFGLYKSNRNHISSLKSKEYLSYGLPVISGFPEDVFSIYGEEDFYLEFPNDNSSIDMNDIIRFIDRLYFKYSIRDMRERIQRYAKEHVDIEVTMRPVMDYLIGR